MAMNLRDLIGFLLVLILLLAFALAEFLVPPAAIWYLMAIFILCLLVVIWLCYSAERLSPEKVGGAKLQIDDEFLKKVSHVPGAECHNPENLCEAKLQIDNEFLQRVSGVPDLFNYSDLETATNYFAKEIGEGGFGSVFEGSLSDGRKVAVKRVKNPDKGLEEYKAQVTTLPSLNHSNLVRLYGLCIEGPHCLLVYEFMENGSLHDWLFNSQRETLDWKTRHRIALQTARGLKYLHEDSNSRILHLDVKPQNILLDENFTAKVSDFGLARLLNKDESRVETVHERGTPGYKAPECISEYVLTAKTDVYSYGLVLLQMVSRRRVVDECLRDVALGKAREGIFAKLYDSRFLVSEEEALEMKKVIIGIKLCSAESRVEAKYFDGSTDSGGKPNVRSSSAVAFHSIHA